MAKVIIGEPFKVTFHTILVSNEAFINTESTMKCPHEWFIACRTKKNKSLPGKVPNKKKVTCILNVKIILNKKCSLISTLFS